MSLEPHKSTFLSKLISLYLSYWLKYFEKIKNVEVLDPSKLALEVNFYILYRNGKLKLESRYFMMSIINDTAPEERGQKLRNRGDIVYG